jgi:hypothetical protein
MQHRMKGFLEFFRTRRFQRDAAITKIQDASRALHTLAN